MPFGAQRLDCRQVYFNRECFLQRLDGYNNAMLTFESDENSFDSFERPMPDADPLAVPQEWVRRYSCGTIRDSFYGLDVVFGNRARATATFYKLVHSCRSQNIDFVIQVCSHEQITRKQRQQNCLVPIFPTANRSIRGKQNLKTFPGQQIGRFLLVLVLGINRVPSALPGHRRLKFDYRHKDKAPLSELQLNSFVANSAVFHRQGELLARRSRPRCPRMCIRLVRGIARTFSRATDTQSFRGLLLMP